jgi:hypothetical protein
MSVYHMSGLIWALYHCSTAAWLWPWLWHHSLLNAPAAPIAYHSRVPHNTSTYWIFLQSSAFLSLSLWNAFSKLLIPSPLIIQNQISSFLPRILLCFVHFASPNSTSVLILLHPTRLRNSFLASSCFLQSNKNIFYSMSAFACWVFDDVEPV